MRPKILTIGIVSLLFGSILFGMFGFVDEVEGATEDWIEEIIKDTDKDISVFSIATGDADNDGNNEVVIGLQYSVTTNNELRVYEKVSGVWSEEIIADINNHVWSVVIGDADNDGYNEVVAGTDSSSKELVIFQKEGDVWVEDEIKDTPIKINSIAIGDADNDGKNEVVIGMESTLNEVRAYKYDDTSGNWGEIIITDVGSIDVNSVVIGDADNDGKNEIVVGTDNTTNEVRAYENVTGVWEEDNIADIFPSAHVLSVAIGDADNDDNNEVVIGLESTTDEVRMLKYSGAWMPESIANVPSDVNSIVIGDADNDGNNEVVIGTTNTTGEVRIYKKDGTWSGAQVADVPTDVWSVAIGDADNDGKNDVVIGMGITTNEVRLYSLDKGQITFTSHTNGDYVSGTTTFEVLVTSDFVDAVKFYVNNEPKFTDSSYPYQFINDTTKLMEDATYTIKAEGLRNNAPPLIATVDVIVNNAVQTGYYISVSTLKTEYGPDQEVSVVVSTKTPPSYDSLNLVVSYTDPTGNTMSKMEESLPSTTQYIVILPLSSDAALGTYTLTANAYGYDGEVLIWEAANGTTFNVSGKSLHEQLTDLYAQHDVLNSSINSLSDVVENEHEFSRSEILDRINTSITEIQGIDDIINDHDSEIKGILNSLNDLVENEHNMTKTELLDELVEVLSQLQGVDDDVNSEASVVKNTLAALDADLAALDQDLDATKDDVKSVSEAQDLYAIIAIVLLVIALIILIIGMFLTMKANKMLKGFGGGPGMEMPYEEKIEPEIKEEPYEEPEKAMEESADVIDEIVEELEEPPKKKSGRGRKKK